MRTELTSIKEIPGLHLMGHTCANLNGELLFVWGGASPNDHSSTTNGQQLQSQSQSQQVNDEQLLRKRNADLWIYETLTGYWRHRRCSGECPPYLSSCSSCLIGQRMFIFGGHSTELDDWLNCLYCLNLETFEWIDLGSRAIANEPTKPIRSDKNVCWSYANKLYVFGGYGWSRTDNFMDILDRQHDFQLMPDFRWPKFGWNNQLVEFDPMSNKWRWPAYCGKCPSARAAHSGTLMSNGKFYLFGGRDSQERLNDLYTFDMKKFEWTQLTVVECNYDNSRNIQRPINYLSTLNEQVDNNYNDNDDDDDDEQAREREEAEHSQIIEEMQNVKSANMVANTLIFEPMPSSSSSFPTNQTNIEQKQDQASNDDNYLKHQSIDQNQSDDDYEDDDYEYPHPSHLLERWSLGSQQQQILPQLFDDNFSSSTMNPQCLLLNENSNAIHKDYLQLQIFNNLNEGEQELQVNANENDSIMSLSHDDNQSQAEPQVRELQQQAGAIVVEAQQVVEELKPVGRSFCSFTQISDDIIILFGGVSSQDQNLSDCWQFDIRENKWNQLRINAKHRRPRLWHSGSRTKQGEVVIIGGSSSDSIDEFCTDVLVISLEPKSLKRLALDAVSKSVRLKTIQKCPLPSTICKLIKLRKQAIVLTSLRRSAQQQPLTLAPMLR